MELGIAEPAFGKTVHRRRGNRTTERVAGAKSHVIGEDQQNIWCSFWCSHFLREIQRRILRSKPNVSFERWLGTRQNFLRARWQRATQHTNGHEQRPDKHASS